MGKKKPPGSIADNAKRSFSRHFDTAMVETRMIDAIVKADGWSLAEFTSAPPWLRQIYNRHALAACEEMQNIEKTENSLKPSEHE